MILTGTYNTAKSAWYATTEPGQGVNNLGRIQAAHAALASYPYAALNFLLSTPTEYIPVNDDENRQAGHDAGVAGGGGVTGGYDFLLRGNYVHPCIVVNLVDGTSIAGGKAYYAGSVTSFTPTMGTITRNWIEVFSTDDLVNTLGLFNGGSYDIKIDPCITRVALGTTTSLGSQTLTLSNISVKANERLVVLAGGTSHSSGFPADGGQTCTYDGNSMNQDSTSPVYQVNNIMESSVFSIQPGADTTNKSIVFTNTSTNVDVFYSNVILALKIQGLPINALDVAAFPVGGLGGDLGPSGGAFTSENDEMLIGAGFCMGPVTDTDGSWSFSFNAGQIDGSASGPDMQNIKASEGYLAVTTTGSPYTAKKTGIGGTSAQSYNIMHLCTYK